MPETDKEDVKSQSSLGSWCHTKLSDWEDVRDTNYRKRWEQYERLMRGIWSSSDRSRTSERSRYISPALSQAIESVVAEVEEVVFSTGKFFDIDADVRDEDRESMTMLRDMLFNDMMQSDIHSSISEIILNGAVYGTGIGKIIVEVTKNKYLTTKPVNGLAEVVEVAATGEEEVVVRLVPVSPREFVIDSASRNISDALGMGHITIVPLHLVKQRISDGIYEDVDVSAYHGEETIESTVLETKGFSQNDCKIYEYHGLVPVGLLAKEVLGEDADELEEVNPEEDELTEAIITLTEDAQVLRAISNPNTLQDRNFIAFQFDTIASKFWGRGVAEKGYNSQMALDSEERGRIDAMALSVHPMMAIDANSMPRGSDTKVRAGRSILTNGNPKDILMPINFGTLGTDTFRQSGELERQLVKATGAFDDNAMSANNAKTGAMGIAVSGVIKRSRRTLKNFERSIISPMVHKFAWRYMQFAPEKYPQIEKPTFTVVTSQGIIAKEWETTQLANMLKTTSQDSPAYWMLLKGVYQNSSIRNREAYDKLIDQNLEKSMNPQPDPVQQAEMQARQAEIKISMARARAELLRIEMDAQKLEGETLKTETEAILNLAKAESEEAGKNMNEYQTILSGIQTRLDLDMKKSEAAKAKQQQAQAQQAPQGQPPVQES